MKRSSGLKRLVTESVFIAVKPCRKSASTPFRGRDIASVVRIFRSAGSSATMKNKSALNGLDNWRPSRTRGGRLALMVRLREGNDSSWLTVLNAEGAD